MLKYICYSNIFFGIIFLATLKSSGNYLDMFSAVPAVFFNWVTLFHFIRNKMRFEKWHLTMGIIALSLSILSTVITTQSLIEIYSFKTTLLTASTFLILARQFFDFCVIFQFIIAYKANKKLNISAI